MVRDYIILASGCFLVGVAIALVTVVISIRLRLDILCENAWMLAMPALLAVIINIDLQELIHKFKTKK